MLYFILSENLIANHQGIKCAPVSKAMVVVHVFLRSNPLRCLGKFHCMFWTLDVCWMCVRDVNYGYRDQRRIECAIFSAFPRTTTVAAWHSPLIVQLLMRLALTNFSSCQSESSPNQGDHSQTGWILGMGGQAIPKIQQTALFSHRYSSRQSCGLH